MFPISDLFHSVLYFFAYFISQKLIFGSTSNSFVCHKCSTKLTANHSNMLAYARVNLFVKYAYIAYARHCCNELQCRKINRRLTRLTKRFYWRSKSKQQQNHQTPLLFLYLLAGEMHASVLSARKFEYFDTTQFFEFESITFCHRNFTKYERILDMLRYCTVASEMCVRSVFSRSFSLSGEAVCAQFIVQQLTKWLIRSVVQHPSHTLSSIWALSFAHLLRFSPDFEWYNSFVYVSEVNCYSPHI